MTNTTEFQKYTLATEELALAFGIFNRPDLSRRYMKTLGDAMAPSEMDLRLKSASHSLLARGLTDISKGSAPDLAVGLQNALLPLAKPDGLIQIAMIQNEKNNLQALYFNRKQNSFTCHWIEKGVVQHLENGDLSSAIDYISDRLGAVNGSGSTINIGKNHNLTLKSLGLLAGGRQNDKKMDDLLKDSGLSKNVIDELLDDLKNYQVRGTVFFIDIDSDRPLEEMKLKTSKGLLFITGQKRLWSFLFDEFDRDGIANISRGDRAFFLKQIQSLLRDELTSH